MEPRLLFQADCKKNGQLIHPSIKKDTSHLAETSTCFDRQDVWALLNSMEAFGMAVRGFADSVDLLLNPDILTGAYMMNFYRRLASLYDAYDFNAPVTTLVHIFEDHVSSYFVQV